MVYQEYFGIVFVFILSLLFKIFPFFLLSEKKFSLRKTRLCKFEVSVKFFTIIQRKVMFSDKHVRFYLSFLCESCIRLNATTTKRTRITLGSRINLEKYKILPKILHYTTAIVPVSTIITTTHLSFLSCSFLISVDCATRVTQHPWSDTLDL